MTIEEKLAIIQKAIEMGAEIDIKFHGISGKNEAEKIADKFSELLESKFNHSEGNNCNWFSCYNYTNGIDCTIYYSASKDEKKADLLKQLAALEKEEEVRV